MSCSCKIIYHNMKKMAMFQEDRKIKQYLSQRDKCAILIIVNSIIGIKKLMFAGAKWKDE